MGALCAIACPPAPAIANTAYWYSCGLVNGVCANWPYVWSVYATAAVSCPSGLNDGEVGDSFDLGSCPSGPGFFVVHGNSSAPHADLDNWRLAPNVASGQLTQLPDQDNWKACRTSPDWGAQDQYSLYDYFPNGDFAECTGTNPVFGSPVLALHDSSLGGTFTGGGRANLVDKDTFGDITGDVLFYGSTSSAFTGTVELLQMVPQYSLWIKQRHPNRKLVSLTFDRCNGGLVSTIALPAPLEFTHNCAPFHLPAWTDCYFPFGGTDVHPGMQNAEMLKIYGVFDDGYIQQVVDGEAFSTVGEMFPSPSIALHFE